MKETVSINPLCEFISATPRRKLSIVKNLKTPVTFIVARYSTARSRMIRFFKNNFSTDEIISGIEMLSNKKSGSEFQNRDKVNSIEALRRFLQLQFPHNFSKLKCSFSKEKEKNFDFEGTSIVVSPDIIIRWEENGIKHIGGIKFHISKSKQFDWQTSTFAAGIIQLFLENTVAKDDEVVNGDYCLCVDVFGERVCSAPRERRGIVSILSSACREIKELWNVAL